MTRWLPHWQALLGWALAMVWPSLGLAQAGRVIQVNSATSLRTSLTTAQPGDTYVWRNGTYSNQTIVFEAQGTAEAPITLRAETPGGVILRGSSLLQLGGRFLIAEGFLFTGGTAGSSVIQTRAHSDIARHAYDCMVRHCAIVNHDVGNTGSSSKWVQLYGRRNRFEYNLLSGKTTAGNMLVVELNDPPNDLPAEHVIYRNFFANVPPRPGQWLRDHPHRL